MDEAVILFLLVGAAFIWLTLISYFLSQDRNFLQRFFPNSEEKAVDETVVLRKKFEEILIKLDHYASRERVTAKHLQEIRKEGLSFIQIVEMMRYNPYGDVGGDQSFSLLLADGKKNGMILTSLHARSASRVYVKTITEGKSEVELSAEEKKLLKRIN